MTTTTSPYILKQLLTYRKGAPVVVDREWARFVTSYQDIPDEFLRVFPETTDFPYTVYLAEESGSMLVKKRPAQLLSLYPDHLIVREAQHGEVSTNGYPYKAVSKIEHSRVLLNSWLKITTSSSSVAFRFNTVTEQLFAPVIHAIRSRTYRSGTEIIEQKSDPRELAKLSYLWSKNMKCFHAARESLLPGAKILGSTYQPEQHLPRQKTFALFGRNPDLSGHVAILTDRDLILIRERQSDKGTEKSGYGSLITYLPISQIQHISFQKLKGIRDWAMEATLFDYTWKRVEFASDSAINFAEFQAACRNEFGSRTN